MSMKADGADLAFAPLGGCGCSRRRCWWRSGSRSLGSAGGVGPRLRGFGGFAAVTAVRGFRNGAVRYLVGVEMCNITDENPVRFWPAGVDGTRGCRSLSGGDVECVAIFLVLGVGSCLRAKALVLWSGTMAASMTSFLCWEPRARRLSFLLALLQCLSWP